MRRDEIPMGVPSFVSFCRPMVGRDAYHHAKRTVRHRLPTCDLAVELSSD